MGILPHFPAAAVTPSGPAGGVLGGTYPAPAFAADMATQAELDAHATDTTSVHGITDTTALLESGDAAGGVLAGTYPNPTFAADMATQAELDLYFAYATTITSVPKAADYTLTAGDAAIPASVDCSSGSAIVITIPTNASVPFAVGTVIEVARLGTGSVTIAGPGVTLRAPGGMLTLRAQYSTASLRKIATDEWLISGDLG